MGREKMANKSDIVEMVAVKLDVSKKHAAEAVEAVLDAITAKIIAGEKVAFVGFGSFSVSERSAREGINPKTKEKIQIAASKSGKFSAGRNLKNL